jgi:hypothetical protein
MMKTLFQGNTFTYYDISLGYYNSHPLETYNLLTENEDFIIVEIIDVILQILITILMTRNGISMMS